MKRNVLILMLLLGTLILSGCIERIEDTPPEPTEAVEPAEEAAA